MAIYAHPTLMKNKYNHHLMALMQGPQQLKPKAKGKHFVLEAEGDSRLVEILIENYWIKTKQYEQRKQQQAMCLRIIYQTPVNRHAIQ